MPKSSYIISGLAYDTGGSAPTSAEAGLWHIEIYDITLGQNITGTVASDGSFSADLANLTSEFSDGDRLQVVIYNTRRSKSTEFRHTVDSSQAGHDFGTLYMHWTEPSLLGDRDNPVKTVSGMLSNKTAGALTIDLYDRKNDDKIPENNTILVPTDFIFEGGICIIRESDAANSLEAHIVVR